MDDDEICYECSGYGDDYFINDDGEMECWCPYCWVTKQKEEEDDPYA